MKILLQTLIFLLFVSSAQAQQSDQTIEHDGVKIHYTIVGAGKPILLLSGVLVCP